MGSDAKQPKRTVRAWAVGAACCISFMAGTSHADGQILWSSAGGSAWLTASNWTGGAVPNASQVARFSADPTGVAGVGINFAGTTNGNSTLGQKTQLVGAIEMVDRTQSFLIGNSSTTTNADGFLVLNGAAVNAVSNTVLRNATNVSFALQNTQGTGNRTMGVRLGNLNSVVQIDGVGNIVMSSVLSEVTPGSRLEVMGEGAGQLELNASTNSFTGGVTVRGAQLRFATDGSLGIAPSSAIAGHIILNGGRVTIPASATVVVNANRGIQVGDAAGTAFNIGGTAVLRYAGVIADLPGKTGTFAKLASGTLELGGANTYSGATTVGQGTLRMIDGTNRLPATTVVRLGTAGAPGLGTFDLNGLSQQIAGLESIVGTNNTTSTNLVNSLSAATLTIATPAGASLRYSAGTGANSGVISGAISIVKKGPGTQAVGGSNTYAGTTVISDGVLLVNGAHTGGGAYTVENGGMLAGSGSIGSTVTVETGGKLSAGESIGSLTISRSVALQADAVFVVDFDLSSADQLVVTGATSTLGTANAVLVLQPVGLGPGPFGPINVTYTIATTPNSAAGVSGVFKNLVHLAGNTYQYSSGLVEGTVTYGGNSITMTVTAVPEPAAVSLLAMASLVLRRRRARMAG